MPVAAPELLAVVGLLLTAATAGAQTEARPQRILIYRVTVDDGIEPSVGRIYEDQLQTALAERTNLPVLTGEDLKNMVAVSADTARAQNCFDEECFVALGELVDADFVVVGSVLLADGGRFLTLKVYDRQRRDVCAQSSGSVPVPTPEARARVDELTGMLVAQLQSRLTSAGTSLWDNLDTTGKAGIAVGAGGLLTAVGGVVAAVVANSHASQVERQGDYFANQPAAIAAREAGHAATGLFIAAGVTVAVGTVLTIVGWEEAEP